MSIDKTKCCEKHTEEKEKSGECCQSEQQEDAFSVTFENEIAYRQRKEIELENKLKKANETIAKLEKQLECQKELKD